MGVPKQKRSKTRQRRTRMHIFLKEPVLASCPKCKNPVKPHTICQHCGYYKGREVINVLAKLDKKEKKQREREMKTAERKEKEKPLSLEELSKK